MTSFHPVYTEAILPNSTRKLLRLEIAKMPIAVLKIIDFIVLFIIIFGTLSYPINFFGALSHRIVSPKEP